MENKEYNVVIKLIGNQNPCHSGHKIGDEWLWEEKTPAGMCFAAYNSLYPFALVLKCGGNFPWQENPDILTLSCPDPEVVNRFELRRVPEKGEKAEQYDISLKLVGKGNTGECGAGHRIGDEWLLNHHTPENLCPAAYNNIYTSALVLQCGGTFSWQQDPDTLTVSCPDPNVLNQFEIRRIPAK